MFEDYYLESLYEDRTSLPDSGDVADICFDVEAVNPNVRFEDEFDEDEEFDPKAAAMAEYHEGLRQ